MSPLGRLLARPVSVLLGSATLVALGAFSLLRLPVTLLPRLDRPRLVVVAVDHDRSRDDLLRQLVEPLELRLLALGGVRSVASSLNDGEARLVLDTEWQTDGDRLRVEVEQRLGELTLEGLDELTVRAESSDRAPIVAVAVLGGDSAHRRTVFAERSLLPELGRLPGAGEIRRVGGAFLRPVVRPHGAALAARGLSPVALVERLDAVGRRQPAGRVRDGALVHPLLVHDAVSTVETLRRLPLDEDGPVLGEVADVALREVPDEGLYRWNGRDGVRLEVYRAPQANAVELSREVRRAVAALAARTTGGLELRVVEDTSREVTAALAQLGLAGLVGLLLGTLVLRSFLGSLAPTLALALVVPASVLATFGVFLLFDVALDVVSLAGLALAVGMLVDNAIVVLESISSAGARGVRGDGGAAPDEQSPPDPVLAGTQQIALPLVASFATTAVVFVPLLYLRGLARAFFGVQAFAIVSALALSLLLSLTLTPVLARLLGVGRGAAGRQHGRSSYLRLLRRTLDRPGTAAAGALAATALVVAGGLAALERSLVPGGGASGVTIEFRLPRELAPEAAHAASRALEEAARRSGSPPARSELVYRPPALADAERGFPGRLRFADGASPSLDASPGVELRSAARRTAFAAALERASGRFGVEVTASSQGALERLLARTARALEERGLEAAPAWDRRPAPAWVLAWDPLRLAASGLDARELEEQVRSAAGGLLVGRTEIAGAEPEILVESARPALPALLPMQVRGADGERAASVPLAALASIRRELEPPPDTRVDGRPAARLELRADGDLDVRALEEAAAAVPVAEGESVRLVGQGQELRRSFAQLRFALGGAVLLVFLTVAALYESWTLPLVVLATVPVAAAGALALLVLCGQSLNVLSLLGILLLTGIVVNNSIVLVHRIEQWRNEGLATDAAIEAAAAERYRPILMTSLTTLVGMLPLAALGGEGVELRRALAVAVMGGLVTALLASLLLIPALYRILCRRRHFGARAQAARSAHPNRAAGG